MAVIKEMPGLKIISGFRGVLDFYYWRGIPVVRKWPRKPITSRNPNVRAQWPIFTASTRLWNQLSPSVRQAYTDMASSTRFTGRDIFTRAYISGVSKIYRR